jgi:hypothetical protein
MHGMGRVSGGRLKGYYDYEADALLSRKAEQSGCRRVRFIRKLPQQRDV